MRDRLAPLLASLAVLIGLALAALTAPPVAKARPTAADTATISGVVVNGTHAHAPVAGQSVTLQVAVSHTSAKDVAQTTTDTHGHFTFSGLDGSGATTYAVYTQFQQGTFASDAVTFTNGTAQPVTLTVYDGTNSDAHVRIALTTILLSEPNTHDGLIPVGEVLTFDNSGDTAYIPTTAPANGMPMGLLRFAVPPSARNLALGEGFAGAQVIQVGTGFGTTATVPPGKSQFAFAFDLPYTDTTAVLDYKTEYRTDQVAVLVPPGMHATSGDLAAQPAVQAAGQSYNLFTRSTLPASAQLTLRLVGLPLPGEDPTLQFAPLLAVGGGLVLLLAVLLLLYLRRGALAVVLRLVPASALRATTPGTAKESPRAREAERKRLLKSLLALERAHAEGTLPDEVYRARRERHRAALRELIAADASAQPHTLGHTVDTIPASAPAADVAEPSGAMKGGAQ